MKMKLEHFNVLQSGISAILINRPTVVQDYEQGLFLRSDAVKDLQARFCWDLFAIFLDQNEDAALLAELYAYLNDDHIYTALKKICPKVVRKY